MDSKIVQPEAFQFIREELKRKNKKIVHCHGVFDLVHPGHIIHFKQAKSYGDILVVSITGQDFVQKGPGRPYFNDELRLMYLSNIDLIDYVILDNHVTALEIIELVQPDFYAKGKEYEIPENDLTANITDEVDKVKRNGGKVIYTEGDIFSSTNLINNHLNALPAEVIEASKNIKKNYDLDYIKSVVEQFKDIRILVTGDIIIDEYVFCVVQGVMSKDQGSSTKHLASECYLGGTLAIANHLSSFSDHVTLCSCLDNKNDYYQDIMRKKNPNLKTEIVDVKNYDPIVKRKYIQKRGKRKEYNKIFSINFLNDSKQDISKQAYYDYLDNNIDKYDMVVLCDFGHGQIDKKSMDIIQKKSKYLALNCQTNSSNFGFNIITKYDRADTFSLDEKEIELAFSDKISSRNLLLKKLRKHFNASYGWLTMGSSGAFGINKEDFVYKCPALTLQTIDTVGAGDALFSIVSLCSYCNTSVEIGTLLGNAAGALLSNQLGNSAHLSKAALLKFVSTILNI